MDPEPVRQFGCFTADLLALADWLQGLGIRTVALQSTGVHHIPLCDILSERGIRVFVVNPCETKNLPGRKSDMQECQWLLKLHVYGLLHSVVPERRMDAARLGREWFESLSNGIESPVGHRGPSPNS